MHKKSKSEFTHGGSIWKSIALLLKTIFAALGYGLIWLGLIFMQHSWWITAVVCGAVITFVSVLLFIIDPLLKSRRRR